MDGSRDRTRARCKEEHPAVHCSAAAKFGALQAPPCAAAAAHSLLNQACTGAGLWALTGWDIPHSGWSPSAMKKSLPPGMKHTWPRFTSIVLPSYGGSCGNNQQQILSRCVEASANSGKAAAVAVRTRLLGLAWHGAFTLTSWCNAQPCTPAAAIACNPKRAPYLRRGGNLPLQGHAAGLATGHRAVLVGWQAAAAAPRSCAERSHTRYPRVILQHPAAVASQRACACGVTASQRPCACHAIHVRQVARTDKTRRQCLCSPA